jgi:Cytochrome C oxidase, cbb3-type, subunit III
MLRYFFIAFILITVAIVSLAGFRGEKSSEPPVQIFPDMKVQPRYDPQHTSTFFSDGSAGRKPVAGTIPLGYTMPGSFLQAGAKNGTIEPTGFANKPDYYNTGKMGDSYGDGFPMDVTEAIVLRGQERFNINCAVCHGKAGLGNGVISKFGIATIVNLQDDRIRTMPDGQIFSTLTNGKNTMGAYGPQIAVDDRWAIVAYVRALQKSQGMKLTELSADKQKELQSKQ